MVGQFVALGLISLVIGGHMLDQNFEFSCLIAGHKDLHFFNIFFISQALRTNYDIHFVDLVVFQVGMITHQLSYQIKWVAYYFEWAFYQIKQVAYLIEWTSIVVMNLVNLMNFDYVNHYCCTNYPSTIHLGIYQDLQFSLSSIYNLHLRLY